MKCRLYANEWFQHGDKFVAGDNVEIEFEAENLDKASIYVLANFPKLYVGCNIKCENGDFLANAIPNYYVENYGCKSLDEIIGMEKAFMIRRLADRSEDLADYAIVKFAGNC